MKGEVFLFLIILGILTGKALELKNGDLIFVGEGKGDFSKAISESTANHDSIRFVHVGIIEIDNGETFVIEASPDEGVRKVSIQQFLEHNPLIVIKRIKIDFPVEAMLEKAKSHIEEEYDWLYLPNNGKMYCSELVYETYLDKDGNHLFNSKPMNFRSPDGSMPQFWIDLFERLGTPIPEGVEGTNPADLSASPLLENVFINK